MLTLATCSCPSLPILLSKIEFRTVARLPSGVERQEATLVARTSAGFCLSGVLLGCASLPESRTVLFFILLRFAAFLVGLGRLELPTSPLSGVRSNHLSYRPNSRGPEGWWSWSGSNRRPPECKSGALPAELQPLLSQASCACFGA